MIEKSGAGRTAQLSDWVEHVRLVDGATAVASLAKLHILDTFAVAVAGMNTAQVSTIASFLDEGIAPNGASLGLGSPRYLEASSAALINGVAAHSLDFDDQSYRVYGHTSTVVLPALLALAQENGNSGSELITAFLVGTEAASKIGRVMNPSHFQRGWHSTGTLGALGAAVGCARLLGLGAIKVSHALGLAAVRSGGLRANNPTMAKAYQAGQAAQAAVISAKLAAAGMTACESILEAPTGFGAVYNYPDSLDFSSFDSLGKPWEVAEPGMVIKRYPACSSMATALDAMGALLDTEFATEDIEKIECVVTPLTAESMSVSLPETGYAGKFSIPFCLASLALYGKVELDSFDDAVLLDEQFRAIADRVTIRVDESDGWAPEKGPEAVTLTLTLRGGRQVSERRSVPTWGCGATLAVPDILAKAKYCFSRSLGANDTEFLSNKFRSLESESSLDFLRLPDWG